MGFLVALGKNLFDALLGFLDLPADNLTWQRKNCMFIVKINLSMEFMSPWEWGDHHQFTTCSMCKPGYKVFFWIYTTLYNSKTNGGVSQNWVVFHRWFPSTSNQELVLSSCFPMNIAFLCGLNQPLSGS